MMFQFFNFHFYFGVSTLFLFNKMFKLSNFYFILVSQLYFYSIKCLNFSNFFFYILASELYFCSIKYLNFLFLFNQMIPNPSKLKT